MDNPAAGDETWQTKTNAGPHTITISDGTVLSLPYKQARTSFRYPWMTSKVLPGRTPKWLVDNGFMLPFNYTGAMWQPITPVKYDGPNAFPGMTRYMGSTGERPEIGLQTDWAADYMKNGDPTNLLNVAEGAGTAPCGYIDQNTGKPVDKLNVYFQANSASAGPGYNGSPWMCPAPAPYDTDPNVIYFASNHSPEISYLAALITEDPWHLKQMQRWTNYMVLTDAWTDYKASTPLLMAAAETRQNAWETRTVAMCAILTEWFEQQGKLPSDCLPSSYFYKLIDNSLNYYINNRMQGIGRDGNPDSVFETFRVLDADSGIAPWQVDYQLETYGWMVSTKKFPKANTLWLWLLGNPIARTNGTSGWAPSYPCPYYMGVGAPGARLASWKAAMDFTLLPTAQGGQLGDQVSQKMHDAVIADPFCGGNFAPDTNYGYPMETHAVLSQALWIHEHGIVNVTATYPDLPTCYANLDRMTLNKEAEVSQISGRGGYFFAPRDAMSYDPSLLPPDVVIQPTPPGTPNPPPTGALHMAGTGNISVGQTEHATLTFDDGKGNPSQAPTNLTYAASPATTVTLAPDATGVSVTGAAAGDYTLTATADNGLTASLNGTVGLPLAGALHLSWD